MEDGGPAMPRRSASAQSAERVSRITASLRCGHGPPPRALRPLVHRLVRVHVLAIEHGHPAQRLGAIQLAVLVEVMEAGRLPGGAVLHGHAAALHYPEQALAVRGGDAGAV